MMENAMKAEAPLFRLSRGRCPLIVSIPHGGTQLPSWLLPRLTREALRLADTDWYLERLYDFLDELDITLLAATHSRYVVDLNRPPDDASMYPGQSATGICPIDNFEQQSLYVPGMAPDLPEVHARVNTYWRPYHAALGAELERLRAIHGCVVLWDAHSIRSHLPRFFEGELPHLNIGTADHQACDAALPKRLGEVIHNKSDYSWVVNGRFKGGYITRHYGRPAADVHALQIEMAMRSCMPEREPAEFDEMLAKPMHTLLRALFESVLQWQHSFAQS